MLNKKQFKQLMKEYNKAIAEHRLEIWALNLVSKTKNKLNAIYAANKNDIGFINENLYELLTDSEMIFAAYDKLIKNITNETACHFSIFKAEAIQWKLENNLFKFTKIRQVKIPKNGGKIKTLKIINFEERIVQECIRVILNVIYEPQFQTIEANHWFRPNRNTRTCMLSLQETSQGMTTAIEACIKEGYDNIKPNILKKILKKKIKDERFINLIDQSMATGGLTGNIVEKKLFGILQRSIVAPTLFNIYMHELDLFIIQKITEMLGLINISEKRGKEATFRISLDAKNTNARITSQMESNRNLIKTIFDRKMFRSKYRYKNVELHKTFKKEREENQSLYLKVTGASQKRKLLMFNYNRYADDFIILTNAKEQYCKKIRNVIGEFLKKELDLELSKEKTLITNLKKKKAKFLGFTVYDIKQNKIIKVARTLTKKEKAEQPNKIRTTRRKLNVGIRIGIDKLMVLERMKEEGIINYKSQPTAVVKFLILNKQEIVKKFNQKAMKLTNYYYKVIAMKSSVKHLLFILRRSCENTLARKLKKSVRELKLGLGLNLEINYENTSRKDMDRISLLEYKELIKWAEHLEIKNKKNRFVTKNRTKKNNQSSATFEIDVSIFKYTIGLTILVDDIYKGFFFEKDLIL